MPTVEEVGEKIRASIRAVREKGWDIKPGSIRFPHLNPPACCAVGAVVYDLAYDSDLYDAACNRLSLNIGELTNLACGFDGSKADAYPEWYSLGASIRNEVDYGEL